MPNGARKPGESVESPLATILYSIRQPWRNRARCLGESADLFHSEVGSNKNSEAAARLRIGLAGCALFARCETHA